MAFFWQVFLLMDENKIVWFERGGNKLGRFDPQTEAFKEFDLPGPAASQFKRRFLLGGQKLTPERLKRLAKMKIKAIQREKLSAAEKEAASPLPQGFDRVSSGVHFWEPNKGAE